MASHKKFNKEEMRIMVMRVLALYETDDHTIANSCESCGIDYSTFDGWVKKFPEFREAYENCKENKLQKAWEKREQRALTAQEKMITGYEVTDTEYVYDGNPDFSDPENPPKPSKVIVKKRTILPSVPMVIFTLKHSEIILRQLEKMKDLGILPEDEFRTYAAPILKQRDESKDKDETKGD